MFTVIMSIIALALAILDLIYFLFFVKLHNYDDADIRKQTHGNITCTRRCSIAEAHKARKHNINLQRV